jgi:hypothetical protein
MSGGQARMSGSPPPRRSKRWSHSRLTACPAPRQPATVGGGWVGRAFGACCFAGKLRSPARPPGDPACPAQLRGLDPTSMGTSTPTAFPAPPMAYPGRVRLPASVQLRCPFWGPVGRTNRGRLAPLGGVERACRKVRFARLIHAAGARSWRTFGPRRLRRQFEPALAATQGGSAWAAPHCRTLNPRGVIVAFKLLEARAGSLADCQGEARTRPRQPRRWRTRRHQRGVPPGTLRPAARLPRSSRSQPSRGQPQRPPVQPAPTGSPFTYGTVCAQPGCRADLGALHSACAIAEPDLVSSPDGA